MPSGCDRGACGLRPSKPIFQCVVDLGLRDVGVRNDPRRHGAYYGKTSIQLFGGAFLSVCVMCAIVGRIGAGAWIVVPFALASTAGLFLLIVRMATRSPMVVLKVNSEGTNQAAWLAIAPFVLVDLAALLSGSFLAIPLVVLTVTMAVLVWRGRGRVPEVLRELRPLLAADEAVLGDAIGLVPRTFRWKDAFRLVVATDRRLLVAASTSPAEQLLLVDVPYQRVSRFGFDWKHWGRAGSLSLTVSGADGAPSETHVINYVAPAHLVSIARALQSNGVQADDPAALAEAERAWGEAVERAKQARPEGGLRKPRLDAAAMNTPDFDHGLWLLFGLAALTFYVNPFGVGIGASRNEDVALLLLVPLVCGVCGYVSRTEASLAYLVPLNLLAVPTFFFWPADYVIAMMFMLSAVAAGGLWVGAKLRETTAGPATADVPVGPAQRPAPGSLRHALSAVRLIRITGGMLAVMAALVVTSAASGIELTSVRLAVDELIGKQLPVDGKSDLTGGAASIRYTPGPDLHEFITDKQLDADSDAGARWELRSSWTKGYNLISLATYRPDPPLNNTAAVKDFLARKDREHSQLAGRSVTHAELTVAGRKGYYWRHDSERGYDYFAAWFPQSVSSVRLECISKNQRKKFERLCGEAIRSLKFSTAAP